MIQEEAGFQMWRTYPGKRGDTLLTVVMAVLLMGLTIPAIYRGISSSLRQAANNRLRVAAINLAQSKLEQLRTLEFSRLGAAGPDQPGFLNMWVVEEGERYDPSEDILLREKLLIASQPAPDDAVEVEGEMTVCIVDVDDGFDGTGPGDETDSRTDFKKVAVEVVWNFQGRPQRQTVESYMVGNMTYDTFLGSTDFEDGKKQKEKNKENKKKAKADKPKGKDKVAKAKDKHVPDAQGD